MTRIGGKKPPKLDIEHMDVKPSQVTEYNTPHLTYFNFRHRERCHFTARDIEILGQQIVEWAANDPQATIISKFYLARGIHHDTINELCKRNPQFKQDFTAAKQLVGIRREDGGLLKVYEPGLIRHSMPLYDEGWKEETERLARIREQERITQETKPLTINMISYAKKVTNADRVSASEMTIEKKVANEKLGEKAVE